MSAAVPSPTPPPAATAPRLGLAGAAGLLAYTAVFRALQHYALIHALHDFWPPLLALAGFLAGWAALNLPWNRAPWKAALNRACLPLGIFLGLYAAYHHLGCWLGWTVTLPQTYWDQLALSFLHGRLYLEAPTYFHDLTPFQSQWYVPNPPLPALLMLPLSALSGALVNAVRFSIFFAALNGLLFFLILGQAARLKWIALDQNGQLWLTALLAFGTPHLYVGINGQMWFLSQVLTVTFAALAVYAALRGAPAWLAGLCLAAAVLARPNVAVLWVFLLAVYVQQAWLAGKGLPIRAAFSRAVQSGLPVLAAVGLLLAYNQARFGSWLDFGYVTINGSDQIVHDAQTYGIFNPVFISRNLWTMFLLPPGLQAAFPYLVPSRAGMSLFLTTPALLWLLRRQGLSIWKLGALASVLLSFLLLVLYHNSGSFQFGYRYLLDFAAPLWLLLGASLGFRVPRLFKALVLLSIAINLLGTVWFAYNW